MAGAFTMKAAPASATLAIIKRNEFFSMIGLCLSGSQTSKWRHTLEKQVPLLFADSRVKLAHWHDAAMQRQNLCDVEL